MKNGPNLFVYTKIIFIFNTLNASNLLCFSFKVKIILAEKKSISNVQFIANKQHSWLTQEYVILFHLQQV